MHFNSKINFNYKAKSLNVGLILTLLLLLVLLFALYVAYSKLYTTLFIQDEQDVQANVVRVNLQQYSKTLEYINALEKYEAPNQTLPRSNIFR